jgi:hypothetical protein
VDCPQKESTNMVLDRKALCGYDFDGQVLNHVDQH